MNRKSVFLPLALLVCSVPTLAGAQQPASKPLAHTYRLAYTLTIADAGKRVGVQHFTMTVSAPTNRGSVKMGEKVPVATGTYSDAKSDVQTQFTYLDVGINISATIAEDANGISLNSKVEQSSVAPVRVVISGVSEPVIRQMVLENTSQIVPGKSVALGSLDIPDSTSHIEIEVSVEQLP
jgi:hypothetical protein